MIYEDNCGCRWLLP